MITLCAVRFTSSSVIKKLHVNNIPTRVAISDVVITKVKLRDEIGYEWDDVAGSLYSWGYGIESEYPDY
ncbi:MAG: hypothetical protein ACJAVL_001770 [Bacteroidia bacterium]|jgi:hypothetical protein